MTSTMSEKYKIYFIELQEKIKRLYEIAEMARSRGIDPKLTPEPRITLDIAERVEKLIGPAGIGERIRQLGSMDRRDMAFKLAEEIVEGRYGEFELEKAADQAIRTALAIITEGVTIAPIEGIPKIVIKQNLDKSRYLSVYFAGPIRPAGGTAQALTLVVAEFVRQKLGLDRFKPSDVYVKRFIEEVRLYERQVRRFQYHVSDEDVGFAIRNLPVEATGVGTDPYDVSSFRNVPGIETNRIRGGALIVVVDGIVGRARKLLGICRECRMDGWEWLSEMGGGDVEHSNSADSSAGFMEEIIVGRPVFSFPGRAGGFRLRYGRARTTGLAAVGVHPATMVILNKFLTTGVQLRMELPGKSAAITPVDSIEPPVVKLRDGTVTRVKTVREAEELFPSVDAILYLGDVLINVGDFLQNNKSLLPAGYDENQWIQDLERTLEKNGELFIEQTRVPRERLKGFLEDAQNVPSPLEAIALSEFGLPLHPKFNYMWSTVQIEELLRLRENLARRWPEAEQYVVDIDEADKSTLERLLVPHRVENGRIMLEEAGPILQRCLAFDKGVVETVGEKPIEIIRELSGLDVREKAPIFVGARMGRPEKAKERKLSPYVHGLFPLESAGGAQRDLMKAKRGQGTAVEIINRYCVSCGSQSFGVKCSRCGGDTMISWRCPRCGRKLGGASCPSCKIDAVAYGTVNVDIRKMLEVALERIGGSLPERFKGVKRLMNRKRIPEPIEKGLLRARYDLSAFKDGTIRFDMTDVPLTHFKPAEVGVSVEKLIELGYSHDTENVRLESAEQMLELKIQDIVVPEACGEYLVEVSKFIDDLLEKLYGLQPFYRIRDKRELVGHIVLGLAPHTSAAVVGRLIGYTRNRVCYAHPLWHAAKRRNCDGDEDAVMLGLDPLLNFSEEYLPEQIGGMMDAPLFVITVINPSEVDKEAHNFDVMHRYPPAFYTLCEKEASPDQYISLLDTIGRRLGSEAQYQGFGFTERCSDINLGSHQGAYTSLQTMLDKLESQMDLSGKLRSVDANMVALRVLNSHFMKDIVGNLGAFTNQGFRCMKCNMRYRRPPLKGVCFRCGGGIAMTVHKGGIEKYLEPALNLVKRYDLGSYYENRLRLVRDEISSLFPADEKGEEPPRRRVDLTDFMRG